MKLIVGLGNPGKKYENNRHNVGHMVINTLRSLGQKLDNVVATKTNTFMNESGTFVSSQYKKYQMSPLDLYIIHDDLDIPLGSYKINFGKGPKDHNGLNDVYQKLGTKEFWHVRVGVDNRDSKNRVSGEEYVLQDFTLEERIVLNKVIKEICKKLVML